MTDPDRSPDTPVTDAGARTAAEGTPVPVDMRRDRQARTIWLIFLAGPVIWFAHFMLVYLVAEAGCTGGGPGLRLFDPPVPAVVTVVATLVAAGACLATTLWALRWWRRGRDAHVPGPDPAAGPERHREEHAYGLLALSGALLSGLSLVAIVAVGAPALVFTGC